MFGKKKFCLLIGLLAIVNHLQAYSINNRKDVFLKKIDYYLFQDVDSTEFYLKKASTQIKSTDSILYAKYLMFLGIHVSLKGENEEAVKNFKKAHAIFSDLKNLKGVAESLINIGEVLYNWARYKESLQYFDDAIAIAEKEGYMELHVRALNYIGKYYHSLGDFNRSFEYYKQSLSLAKEYSDTIGIISIQNKIGKHFETLGNYPKALEYYLSSEELVHHSKNLIETATTYNSLGNIYHLFKEYDKALLFHTKALKSRQLMRYQEGVAKSLNNLGEVLIDTNQLDSALNCFSKSFNICQEIGYTKGSIKSMHNQGVVLYKKEHNEIAIRKFDEALELARKVGYDKGILGAYLFLARIYKKQRKLDVAESISEKGIELAINENVRSSIRDFYFILYEIYTLKSNYRLALDFYKKCTKVNNEIVNIESNNRIAELKSQYEMTLKHRENQVLKKENEINELLIKRKNQLILFSIILSGLMITLIIILYRKFLQKKNANIQLTKLNNYITIKNNELDTLNKKLHKSKDQQIKLFSIISHELRNPIFWFRNLIQMLTIRIHSLDKNMIAKSLDSLNESATNTFHLMDNLLHWSRSQLGNLQFKPEPVKLGNLINENVELISHYANLKKVTINNRSIDDLKVIVDRIMIQTVIRNLLSNAVKFTNSGGNVEVGYWLDNGRVSIFIKDDGEGMDSGTVKKIVNSSGTSYIPTTDHDTGSGIGLALSKEFIELNGGTLEVKSEKDKGSILSFDLPLYNK